MSSNNQLPQSNNTNDIISNVPTEYIGQNRGPKNTKIRCPSKLFSLSVTVFLNESMNKMLKWGGRKVFSVFNFFPREARPIH